MYAAIKIIQYLNLVFIKNLNFKGDPRNWQIPKDEIPANVNGGEGGFMPFGWAGVMAGAAKCFYGFVGFDCVATTGEEAQNPQRNIPLSIVFSLIIIFLSYFGVSAVLTMMWPYYLQDPLAPLPHVFQQIGWIEIKWIVTIGAIFALCTNLLGSMFPLPRVLYSMSSDGILFQFLKRINPKTQTPLVATFLSGLFAGSMSLVFNLHQLIDMMSIGTLLAYTIVSMCVLVLRYKNDPSVEEMPMTVSHIVRQIFNINFIKHPNCLTSSIAKISIVVYSMLAIIFCMLYCYPNDQSNQILNVAMITVAAAMLLIICIIARQPSSDVKLSFKVPMVPLLPCLSIFINLYLMFQLDFFTWMRFCVWLTIGKKLKQRIHQNYT